MNIIAISFVEKNAFSSCRVQFIAKKNITSVQKSKADFLLWALEPYDDSI